jgi:Holliday junction DNA helicase RuvB
MGQSRDTLEDMVEPFLLQRGLVTRSRQGRCATHKAYEHLGMTPPADLQPPGDDGDQGLFES